ncbi:MAG TPA: alanine racemase [Thermoanaerobaculia bacterium]|jgi:alanine racemase
MSTPPDWRPTWAEIDLRAYDRNIAAVQARLPEGSRIIAVLKADGYGHGAVQLARRCAANGVAMIATSLLEEALELRRAGIALPLLTIGPLTPTQVRIAVDADIRMGVLGPEQLESVVEVAREREAAIHLKLDSGMGRMGIIEAELPRAIELLRSAPRLRVEAIYTHFANADDAADPFTEQQLARYESMLAALREAGIDAPLHHTSNSSATMRGLVAPGDFCRVGLVLLGADTLGPGSRLEPVMRWRTEIARLKELPAGHAIGYGTTFHTRRVSRIATLPVGYADGYTRRLSNRAEVLVRGRRAPVVGRVSMDMVTIDVTDIDAAVGDEVVLLGTQGASEIAVAELAAKLDTIPYEVFCKVSARVPRVYPDVAETRSRFDA